VSQQQTKATNKVLLSLFVILIITPPVCVGETFIYIENKPQLWIYPHDPVYQAWYKHVDLIKLANLMQDNGKEQLALFSKTALSQMAIMYEQEAMKSIQEETSGAAKNLKQSRWRHSALEYAQQLQDVSKQINQTSEIVLYIEEYGEPTIVIDGKPYILTTPDLKKSGMLYAAIVEDLCRQDICLQENEKQDAEIDKQKIIINAEWKISETEKPEFLSDDGLYFIFTDLKERKKKQEICLQIMRELNLISESLIEVSDKGVSIDWDVISLERISGDYGYKLIINRFGDSLAMELVYLRTIDAILTEAIPWVQAQLKGEIYQQKFDRADELFSRLLN
jgi:hypothetical protein